MTSGGRVQRLPHARHSQIQSHLRPSVKLVVLWETIFEENSYSAVRGVRGKKK